MEVDGGSEMVEGGVRWCGSRGWKDKEMYTLQWLAVAVVDDSGDDDDYGDNCDDKCNGNYDEMLFCNYTLW